jgi:hypothetical protein
LIGGVEADCCLCARLHHDLGAKFEILEIGSALRTSVEKARVIAARNELAVEGPKRIPELIVERSVIVRAA